MLKSIRFVLCYQFTLNNLIAIYVRRSQIKRRGLQTVTAMQGGHQSKTKREKNQVIWNKIRSEIYKVFQSRLLTL